MQQQTPFIPLSVVYRFLNVLNEATQADRDGITALLTHRVPINRHIAQHHSIQVGPAQSLARDGDLGFLGLLNGLCGVDPETGYGAITAVTQDNGKLNGFVMSPEGPEPFTVKIETQADRRA